MISRLFDGEAQRFDSLWTVPNDVKTGGEQ
jgi:hypothetical protein